MTKRSLFAWLAPIALLIDATSLAALRDDRLSQSRMSLNFQSTDARQVLSSIASQVGLRLRMSQDTGVMVTINQTNATAQELLERIGREYRLEVSISGDELVVTKQGAYSGGGGGSVHHIPLRFVGATELGAKLQSIVPTSEKLVIDEPGNSLVHVGSNETWRKLADTVSYMDVAPVQVLIESQIIETSNQFLRNIGVSLNAKTASGRQAVGTSNPITSAAPSYSGIFGALGGPSLDVKLDAAVSSGDAKVISRPKVLTLNNQRARIESGVEIHVKTLSTAISNPSVSSQSTSTGTPGLAATTGVTTLNAGLTLDILPSVVGSNMIRLTISINNSQPDSGSVVDGIPNIQNNSVSTAILVKNGETAVIAGLVKKTKSDTITGVPFLGEIPILGALFRSSSKTDNNNELVIFITPKIDDGHVDTALNEHAR